MADETKSSSDAADEVEQKLPNETPEEVAQSPADAEAAGSEKIDTDEAHAVEASPEAKWKENADEAKSAQDGEPQKFRRLKKFARAYWARKKWSIPVSVVVLLIILLGLPFTRYPLLGLALKKDAAISVVDSATGQPVTDADVLVSGKTFKTDNKGHVLAHLKVGKHSVSVTKKYYKTYDSSLFVGLTKASSLNVNAVATGRQVPITVTDFVTGKPLENAVITASGSSAKTDVKGNATLVLPAKGTDTKATITRSGYNDDPVTVLITSRVVTSNKFALTASGKLYFLSNQSGKIDVVKTDLDGKNRKTVLAGTGTEDTYSTSLLASRDWKYLALLSKRDGKQGVYLIDTSSDKVTNIDGGTDAASFTLVGWSNDVFVYQVQRTNVSSWQSGASAIKSYDASSGKLYTIDQTQGEGTGQSDYDYTSFGTVALLDGQLAYTKNWVASGAGKLDGKSASLMTANSDGTGKKSAKDFPVPAGTAFYYSINAEQYSAKSLYLQVFSDSATGTNTYYEYEDGNVTQSSTITDDIYAKPYPTYLQSPGGKQTLWSEVRDNKNTLFVGNSDGASGKQIATLSDYTPYGWFTDNYLLVSKNGSELYIMPADGSKQPVKVTDYYKPQLTYKGYGGGYGGI